MSLLTSAYARVGSLLHELLKFGVVGLSALVVDVGLFNVLLHGGMGRYTAKTASVIVATMVAYLGNRYWTFRHRGRRGAGRETALFFTLNAFALVMALACLWVSQHVLGFTGPVADNIAANVVGLGLGTAFRFWSYRQWVFPAVTPVPALAAAPATAGLREPLPALLRARQDSERQPAAA